MTFNTLNAESRVLIIGLGNELRTDDGVGIHAVRQLAHIYMDHADVHCLDLGLSCFSLDSELDWARQVIVLDAILGGDTPGTIYFATAEDFDDQPPSGDPHDLAFPELRSLSLRFHHSSMYLLGIEPETFDFGTSLSPEVLDAFPRFLALVQDKVGELLNSTSQLWHHESAESLATVPD